MKWLIALSAAMSAGSAPAAAQLSKSIDFSDSQAPVTVSHEGAIVTLRPVRDPELDDLIDVEAAIRVPGLAPVVVSEGGTTSKFFTRWVGIGKLSASDAAPSILLEGFTGGAHCCATLRVVTPVGGIFKTIEFEAIDGSGAEAFPTDIDGDGRVDFVRQDDRFRYRFSSGAGSLSPPVIYNIFQGQLVDVSKKPEFAPVWVKFAAEARALCTDTSQSDRNGACAAYVAAAARLGNFEPAMREAKRFAAKGKKLDLPMACRSAVVDGQCPVGMERKFLTFGDALRWFLQDTGYTG